MKVKKFTGKDMAEVMEKIRAELGQNAVILNSKQVEAGGFLGFFTKKNMEVTAAIDPEINTSRPFKRPAAKPATVPGEKSDNDAQTLSISREIEELKSMVGKIKPPAEDYPPQLEEYNQLFIDQEVEDFYRLKIMKKLLEKWYRHEGDNKTREQLDKWVSEELLSLLPEEGFGSFKYEKKYLNVVGPTGVGKTTTLAKMAAKAVLKDNKKVAFITTDTFRIAAIEQLKTYAKILDVPLEVAYSASDFNKALEHFNDYDLILVDSAGRNFRNPLYVDQLNKIIDFNKDMETHLVLAMTSKYRDMKKILEQFQLIAVDKLIFSKLDETDTLGALINIMADCQTGASYLTTGQNVPDDIEEAVPERVIERLLRR
ncbi:flagellar biosynthesis protein FlhF [Salipaludibacillus sp. CUR1]|uniref:flagellar biosynthesis protein FlhF n=1 Tax=Salipaludibacillus sp. CUR1 TaxID=2820003 RepID=UPI001E4541F6|nr:flagellar biosynthesis protein FlhF [Salipaludibacillus sp. CUR1]MCE7794587.1 flagellar biosynthesis protein FlhF [Salipaludibacillus sp. CUR1]